MLPCLNQKHDEHTLTVPMKPTDDDNEAKRTNNLMPSMTATTFKTKTREVLSEGYAEPPLRPECYIGIGQHLPFDYMTLPIPLLPWGLLLHRRQPSISGISMDLSAQQEVKTKFLSRTWSQNSSPKLPENRQKFISVCYSIKYILGLFARNLINTGFFIYFSGKIDISGKFRANYGKFRAFYVIFRQNAKRCHSAFCKFFGQCRA